MMNREALVPPKKKKNSQSGQFLYIYKNYDIQGLRRAHLTPGEVKRENHTQTV